MEDFRTEIIPDQPPEADENKSLRIKRALLDIVETVLLSLILYFGINAVSARIRVESISMEPTLQAGYYVIVNKLAYKFGSPNLGDIIVFHYPPEPTKEPYIKRIIGTPGDVIRVQGGQVYVNENIINEPYLNAAPNYEGTWTIPENQLFVLGDNRNRSSDSHSWGLVPMENVIGKALVIYWPPDAWRVLDSTYAVAASE